MGKLRIIDLDPTVWARGNGDGALLRFVDGKRRQCCIGIACSVLGVADSDLEGNGMLQEISIDVTLPALFNALCKDDGDQRSDFLASVYWANDRCVVSDHDRLRDINARLKDLMAPFRFALKKETDGNQASTQSSGANRGSEAP